MGYLHSRNNQSFEALQSLTELLLPYLGNGTSDQMLVVDPAGEVNAQPIPIGTQPALVTSGATTLVLTNVGGFIKTYVFTGSSDALWTMPALGVLGQIQTIKNIGTAIVTIETAGADEFYGAEAITSFPILPGNSFQLQDAGTYWIII